MIVTATSVYKMIDACTLSGKKFEPRLQYQIVEYTFSDCNVEILQEGLFNVNIAQ